jgi:large subunit ribosomal protein L21
MQYAIIETGGKQYKISKGEILEVEKLGEKTDAKISFDKVLLYVDGEDVQIGMPYLSGVDIKAKVLKDLKGEKIRVAKFKAKSHFHKVTGHRQSLTQVQIEDISVAKKKEK